MNKALLCLIATLTAAGCSKPEGEDATPAPAPASTPKPATPKVATPAATPKPGEWMWKKPKGSPGATDPLSIQDDPFSHKPKK